MICYQFGAGRRQRKRDKWEETTNGKVINKKQSENEMMTHVKYESNGTKYQKQRKKEKKVK